MKSNFERLEGLARKLTIEIPVDKVQSAFSRVYQGIQKNADIKGFRKGKAPIAKIREMYRERVQNDVIQDLVSESYQNALSEHNLEPVGYPQLQVEILEEDKDFKFVAHFEVRPDVQLKKFEGLKIDKEKVDIDSAQVDRIIDNLREQHFESAPIFEDRGLVEKDVANIDFDGTVNGAPLPGGSAQGHMLEIGSNSFIPGFEEALIGMKPSQVRDIELSFPEEYHAKEIAGQPVTFRVKLNSIQRKSLPEVNDAFASKVGGFKSVTELKDAIKADIENRENSRIQTDLRNAVLRALVDANPIEIPKSLQQEQKQRLMEDVKQRMKQQGMSDQQYQEYSEKWGQDFESSASFMVQSTFLIDALAQKFDFYAKENDVEKRILNHAEETGIEIDRLREFYKDPARKSNLRFQITEENVVEFLLSKASITEVPKKVDPKS